MPGFSAFAVAIGALLYTLSNAVLLCCGHMHVLVFHMLLCLLSPCVLQKLGRLLFGHQAMFQGVQFACCLIHVTYVRCVTYLTKGMPARVYLCLWLPDTHNADDVCWACVHAVRSSIVTCNTGAADQTAVGVMFAQSSMQLAIVGGSSQLASMVVFCLGLSWQTVWHAEPVREYTHSQNWSGLCEQPIVQPCN